MTSHTKTNGKHGDFAIEAKGLVKRFKTGRSWVEVLKGVDFDARHGDLTMVMGPSGSGKSTLIANLSGLLKPDEGRVDILDVDDLWKYGSGRIDKFRLDHCGFIFQGFNLFPSLTALQQVATVLKYQGLSPSEAKKRATTALEEVGLGHRLNQRPSALSGGEKQRVAIARALANGPRLLLADEPTGNLDPATSQSVFESLRDLAKTTGVAALIATHNMELAGHMDRVFALRDGHLEERAAESHAY